MNSPLDRGCNACPLQKRSAKTEFYEPHVQRIPNTREHPNLAGRASIKWEESTIRGYDAILIATDHDDVDYIALAKAAALIIDTRNACGRAGVCSDNVVKA